MNRSMYCTAKSGTVFKLRVNGRYYMKVSSFSVTENEGNAVLQVNGKPMYNPEGFLLDIEVHGDVHELVVNEGLVSVNGNVEQITTSGADIVIKEI